MAAAAAAVNGSLDVHERKAQRSNWEEHSEELTLEAMMLDSRAAELDKEERPEVLSLLPSYEGKSVLELGAGIGRFTGELAKTSGHVFAVDFIESVIKKNESINGHYDNTSFVCADVTSPDLTVEANSIDLIFSNWLLMYLSDEEIDKIVERMIKWLKVGGYIFFRESCFHQSGDLERKFNPTHYREPRFYTKVFKECRTFNQDDTSFKLSLVTFKCIGAYVNIKKDQNQICWLWQKVNSSEDGGFQSFLDNVQYKATGILRYERIFGDGYVSTGGVGKMGVEERQAQKSYWEEHSKNLTVEAMMLDSRAADLDKEERPEVLSLLPSYEGKSVLELGAGIGRFTGELAKTAGNVLALDFIESAIKKNESINGHYKNTSFMCADVTSQDLVLQANSIDLIFSNWLLMYLSDEEVEQLVQRMVKWLKVGGYIFFRESCFHQSGDSKRKVNPTHYREPCFYTKVFKECHTFDQDGNSFELSLVTCKCIGAYVKNKKNQNQICWLWQKVHSTEDRGFQRFLDNVQYKTSGILRYERIFGEGYVSTGGIGTTKEFVDKLDLKPGHKVLDVGCGIGGGDFYMAEEYDAHVVGIDLSINMVSFALQRAIGRSCSVEFEVADCTTKTYPDNTFDVIYSRDTILHIHDKPSLFKSFFKWLKPGGKVLISDYCRSPGKPSEEFAAYIKQRGYDLHDVEAYGQMLKSAGFRDVVAEDRTDQFLGVLEKELAKFEKNKDDFLSDFTQEDYDDIVNGWKAKLQRSSAGEQRWGLFIATK